MPAGAIHSDIARGFIRAEIVSYDDAAARPAHMPPQANKV